MNNAQTPRLLTIVFAIEAGFGVILLILTRNWVSLSVIVSILAIVGILGFMLARAGFLNQEWINTNWNNWNNRNRRGNTMTLPGIKINLGNNFEQTEPVNMAYDLSANLKSIQIDLQVGTLRVKGQPGLEKITVTGVKRVWAKDQFGAQEKLRELNVTGTQEAGVLRIYAGTAENINFSFGQVSRVDLEVTIPENMTGTYTTQSGDIILNGLKANVVGRSNMGSFVVENFGAGKNLTLSTQSGNITLQQIAAGNVQANTNLGKIELVGVGAEAFNLESSAGSVRTRGVNAGSYRAKTNAGAVELYDANLENPLELRTNLGRVYAANITTPAFQLFTDAGSVYYLGNGPSLNSEARSNLGSVQLRFAPGTAFNLEANSSVGTVNLGMVPSGVQFQTRNHFSGTVGGGGALVRASSNLGSVQVGN